MAIDLHDGQSEVFEDLFITKLHRYLAVVCSRGWGKSYLASVCATAAIFELLELDYDVPNKVVYIIAPTYDQVIDIYYPILAYDLGLEDYALDSSRYSGRFLFDNNVELRLVSYESVERLRGKGAAFVIWDEISSCKKGIDPLEAWQSVIQPCIATRWSPKMAKRFGAKSPGRALFIGTPKGYNFFAEALSYEIEDDNWKSYHYDYKESPYIDIEEIEKLKHTMDPIKFASEYLALIKESGNNVFYCFDRSIHTRKDLDEFEDYEDVHFSVDFNVGIQATGVFALRGKQLHYLNEFKGSPDTESLAIKLVETYKPKDEYGIEIYPDRKLYCYPDPTGNSNKTSAPVGRTDFSILRSYGITVLARKKSPSIADSVNAVNKHLMTYAGDVNLYFHPRCHGLINSVERTKWVDNNPDLAVIDKKESIEHFSDGVRYAVEYLFPVRESSSMVKRGKNF